MGKKPGVFIPKEQWAIETALLSPAARGAWTDLQLAWATGLDHSRLSGTLQGYARLFGTTVDHAVALIDELTASQLVTKERDETDETDACNAPVTLVKRDVISPLPSSLTSSLRVIKHRESKRKDKSKIPDDFALTNKLREFAEKRNVCNIEIEFQHFCEKARRDGTEWADWGAAWRTWILQGVKNRWIQTTGITSTQSAGIRAFLDRGT